MALHVHLFPFWAGIPAKQILMHSLSSFHLITSFSLRGRKEEGKKRFDHPIVGHLGKEFLEYSLIQ